MEIFENSKKKKRKILWIARSCLIDCSSGASLAVREMLVQLLSRGWQVQVLGLSVLDAAHSLQPIQAAFNAGPPKTWVQLREKGGLTHVLLRTASQRAGQETLEELDEFFRGYLQALKNFQPDVVFFLGGSTFDYLLPAEAKHNGIPCAAYLGNGKYVGDWRWFRDVDVIFTDSYATAQLDKELSAKRPVIPIGCIIDVQSVQAAQHERKHVLFINPQQSKGAVLVAQLALLMSWRRPDIIFEVLETRGSWQPILKSVSKAMGYQVDQLPNVLLTPMQTDMRAVYGRARILLHPSMWWESAGRVIVEAAYNGIPTIATDRGGQAEMLGGSGVLLRMPEKMYEEPYGLLLDSQEIEPLIRQIEHWFDDSQAYELASCAAKNAALKHHNIESNMNKLEDVIMNLCNNGIVVQ